MLVVGFLLCVDVCLFVCCLSFVVWLFGSLLFVVCLFVCLLFVVFDVVVVVLVVVVGGCCG